MAVSAAACGSAGMSTGPQHAGSGPQIIQPGAPGETSKVVGAAQAADQSHVRFTAADVKFMQGMIGHHQQAVEMVALIPSRTSREDMKLLGKRIDLSQADEITMMQRWLEARGQQVPGLHAMHEHGAMLMPGMLTADEMTAV